MQTDKAILTKELHYFSVFLLIYAFYAFCNAAYGIFQPLFIQVFSTNELSPHRAIYWMNVVLEVITMSIAVSLSMLAFFRVKKMQAAGWWISSALFSSWIIGSALAILQLSLMTVGPNSEPLYIYNPLALFKAVFLVWQDFVCSFSCSETL
jgi:hypothetical protein